MADMAEHSREIKELQDRYNQLNLVVSEVRGDVRHVKDRIDNGISSTLSKVWDKLQEIVPIVKDNQDWVTRVKQAMWWISVIGVGGGLVSIAFVIMRKIVNA